MAKTHRRAFSDSERLAVYTVHNERCYMCRKPLTIQACEVDHVIPLSLQDKPARLKEVLEELGRPANFDLDDFENWLPACRSCNGDKLDMVWEPSLAVQKCLQRAKVKAPEARAYATRFLSDREVGKAVAVLKKVRDDGQLTEELKSELRPLVMLQATVRKEQNSTDPILVTEAYTVPLHTVLQDDGNIKIVRGPFGVGAGPSRSPVSSGMRCGCCGSEFFNGAICITCGDRDDGS